MFKSRRHLGRGPSRLIVFSKKNVQQYIRANYGTRMENKENTRHSVLVPREDSTRSVRKKGCCEVYQWTGG